MTAVDSKGDIGVLTASTASTGRINLNDLSRLPPGSVRP
jgi:hypothetical protein